MAKFSVYVPDELWKHARSHEGASDKNPSQLVQEALSEMVARREASRFPLSGAAKIDPERLAKIQAAKRAEVEDLYEVGLESGLAIAEEWPFEALDWLQRFDFDLDRLSDDDWRFAEQEVGVKLQLPVDELEGRWPRVGTVFALGQRHALRSVWEAVVRQEASADSEPASLPDDAGK